MTFLAKFVRQGLAQSSKRRAARIRDFDYHSPMFKNRHVNQERRSRIFADRPYIFGRLPKYLLGWALCMQFWAGYYLYHKHTLTQHLQNQTRKANRRTLPFVQAMEDVRYVAIQERNYMILKAICDFEDPQLFELFRTRYN